MKGVLRQDLFDHFMCLSMAVSIMVSQRLAQDPERREYTGLPKYFVEKGRCLYGPEFLVY